MTSPLHEPVEVTDAALMPLASRILITVFLALLIIPGSTLGLLRLHAKLTARKQPATAPAAAQATDSWRTDFENNFTGRALLIRGNAYLKAGLLHTSTSSRVVIGQAGWLYYADEHGIEDVRHQEPLSPDELRAWGDYLIGLHDFATRRGIHFLFTVAPNKQTIYPEFLPSWVTPLGPQSRLDQLLRYLNDHQAMTIVDLREPLLRNKGNATLYYRTDTHWNLMGMFLAYVPIAQQLHAWYPGLHVPSLDEFTVTQVRTPGGDLARMMGANELLHEDTVVMTPHTPRQAVLSDAGASTGRDVHYLSRLDSQRAGGSVPRAVVYRDSFFESLIPFLAEEIAHGVFIWTAEVDYALIEREHPDLLIFEMIERRLFGPAPTQRPPS